MVGKRREAEEFEYIQCDSALVLLGNLLGQQTATMGKTEEMSSFSVFRVPLLLVYTQCEYARQV